MEQDQSKTESAAAVSSSDLLGRTYQPVMVAMPEAEWLNLQDISKACARLTRAVISRMSAAEDASGKQVWEMFQAHGECVEALKHRPNESSSPTAADGNGGAERKH